MVLLARVAKLEGLDFEAFWERAVRPGMAVITTTTPVDKRPLGCVRWPSDSLDGRFWRDATREAMEGWRRAYEDLPPTPQEKALDRLAPILEALVVGVAA